MVVNVTLRNGKEAPDVLIASTMVALRKLIADQPIAFYELVQICRDREHVLFGDNAAKLKAFGMLDSADSAGRGRVHDAVRDIVLSAVEGEDFNLTLRSPLRSPLPDEEG